MGEKKEVNLIDVVDLLNGIIIIQEEIQEALNNIQEQQEWLLEKIDNLNRDHGDGFEIE